MSEIIGNSYGLSTWGKLRYVFGYQFADSDVYGNNAEYYAGFKSSEGNGFMVGPDIVWNDRPWWEVYLSGTGSQFEMVLINVISDRMDTALTGETVTFNSGTETIPTRFFEPTGTGGLGGRKFFANPYSGITSIGKLTAF
tara:strand:+ start:1184 stop:1603 length:420 start_codon:yes stop_codon:yes gene_type:complete